MREQEIDADQSRTLALALAKISNSFPREDDFYYVTVVFHNVVRQA
jgi:hypothetical protein